MRPRSTAQVPVARKVLICASAATGGMLAILTVRRRRSLLRVCDADIDYLLREHPIVMTGRCLFRGGLELPCRTKFVSATRIGLTVPYDPRVGEYCVTYFERAGRIPGTVATASEAGCVLRIAGASTVAQRIDRLIAEIDGKRPSSPIIHGVSESSPDVTLVLPDGSRPACQVVDLSLVGASLLTQAHLEPGQYVRLGRFLACVTGTVLGGVTVSFEFNRLHERAAPEQVRGPAI